VAGTSRVYVQSLSVRETWVPLDASYSLRWVECLAGAEPVLYKDGKRVTGAWSLNLNVSVPEDTSGASANTA
jgi:hypothetical protein